jgi:ATP-dependent RNA helicase RhlE
MLDMGFIHDVKKILAKTPEKKQTLFFSATIPPEIAALSDSMLSDPVRVDVAPEAATVDLITQSVYFVDKVNKRNLLLHLLKDASMASVLVFTRTKHGADRVVRELQRGDVNAQAIHGDKSQASRQQALNGFKAKTLRVLVATDIAARGIDIDELSHVVNYDLPDVPETYVHRIGRTGRAGHRGIAISFCDIEEKSMLHDIERLTQRKVPIQADHPFPMQIFTPPPKAERPPRQPRTSVPGATVRGSAPGTPAKGTQPLWNPHAGEKAHSVPFAGRNATRPSASNGSGQGRGSWGSTSSGASRHLPLKGKAR